MRETTLKVYRFSELSEAAKDHAKQEYACSVGFSWGDEWMDSLKALAAHFGGSLADWQVDWSDANSSYAKFDMPELSAKEIKSLLAELGTYNKRTGKGHGDCKLTGYCGDEDAIDGFRLAWRKGERDLPELMSEAFDSWIRGAVSDYEGQFEDEYFSETCDANDYEFYEDGELA